MTDQKVMKKWKQDGLDCLVVLNSSESLEWYCGYVGVPKSHPDWRKAYEKIDVDIHGGLTFAEIGKINSELWDNPKLWYFGFDCAHAGDDNDILEFLKQHQDYPRFPMKRHKWTLNEVIEETNRLAEQLGRRKKP